ncbi:MAG TPA: STAS domain-containing protein [Patescibacteria group bacterium]|jgi:anti-sigma B factor antagonist|nr:STAS domain-containing protein [Patescibacteria group bacterium]
MGIRIKRAGRTIRISLRGAITPGCGSGSLRQAVDRALLDGAHRIEIDASGVRFLDAAGLGELVACRSIAARAGAQLVLCGVIGKARELLRITGLDRALLRQPGDESLRGLHWRVA